MKFLVDNLLAPELAERLGAAGHDAVHVHRLGMARAPDELIFDRAAVEGRAVVSADTDFGTLLALRKTREPSVILLRKGTPRRAEQVARLLLDVLPQIEPSLRAGAIVVLEGGRVRVRNLPIGG